MAVGTGFQKAQPASWLRGQGSGRNPGGVNPGPGNRFLLGTLVLEWGLRRKGDAPRAKLGIQWLTPDGVKSKADKALGFKVICFFPFLSQILYSECGYFL